MVTVFYTGRVSELGTPKAKRRAIPAEDVEESPVQALQEVAVTTSEKIVLSTKDGLEKTRKSKRPKKKAQ